MQVNNVVVIARREYLSRVKTKGFWIGTVLLPVLMLSMTILPSLLIARSKSTLRLAIVDQTGKVATPLLGKLEHQAGSAPEIAKDKTPGETTTTLQSRGRQQTPLSTFVVELVGAKPDADAQRAELDRRVMAKEIDAWVWIGADALASNRIEYHGESVSNFVTQSRLQDIVSDVVRDVRLGEAGYDAALVSKLTHSVKIETVRITKEGGKAETGMAGFFFAYAMFFLQYMLLMLYGQQVMSGVLEEKTSRIVEVIVSTVKPFEMMLGKLVGICFVGLSQVLIWLLTAAFITAPGLAFAAATLPSGIPTVSIPLILHFVGHFLMGFFVYASFYAALGAAFNDLREAQQAASSAAFFLVLPVFLMFVIINDPDSPLAVASSLFPPFTPLLMLLRIAVKQPPAWQIALGYLLTTTFVVMMTWMCGKIYRVGILMYGKKPTFKELARWIKYA